MMWSRGRVSVSPLGAIEGWVRDDGLGALYVHDGGNFGFPRTPGWVAFRDAEVTETAFTLGVTADPLHPPFGQPPPVRTAPSLATSPLAFRDQMFKARPPRADRVIISGKVFSVVVSPQPGGTLWKVKGTVDGRVFRSTGASEIAALESWRATVRTELDEG